MDKDPFCEYQREIQFTAPIISKLTLFSEARRYAARAMKESAAIGQDNR